MPAKQLTRTVAMAVLLAVVIVGVKSALPETNSARESRDESSGLFALVAVHVVLVLAVATLLVSILVDRGKRVATPLGTNEFRFQRERGPLTVLYAVVAAGILLVLVLLGFLVPRPATETGDVGAPPDQAEEMPGDAEPPTNERAAKDVPASVVVLGGALVLLTVTGIVVAIARRAVPAESVALDLPTSAVEPAADTLARAAAVGLAVISEPSLDPRAAIIACYLAMEAEFAHDPAAAPLDSDTPSEVLARAVRRGAVHDAAAAELVGLFTEARFSRHDMTESQRADAVRLLQRVERDLGVRGAP